MPFASLLTASLARRVLLCALLAAPAAAQADFAAWLAQFRQQAETHGITPATLDAALGNVQPIERATTLDRQQPEFVQTFSAYLERRVTPHQVAVGQERLAEHGALLDAVEQRYGVPKSVLAAFWGLETNYGRTQGDFAIPAVLATLAYDGRRRTFFESQLIDALRILQAGHVSPDGMRGSWAGAMGHMQFMPSTFLAYAVDADGNGKIDLWNSLEDAMHSAGRYLSQAGWRAGEPVALEVVLPQGFRWQEAQVANRQQLAYWRQAGVLPATGGTLPELPGNAAIVLPQGWRGPAFMVFDNFDVVMQWNRSVSYALTVAHLAQRLAGAPSLLGSDAHEQALTFAEMKALQTLLGQHGYPAGEPDGLPGPRTQAAIRDYQAQHGLPADGYASLALLQHLQQTYGPLAEAECSAPC